MKELIYKTVDGNNPKKKEVSVQETYDRMNSHVEKTWTCKYFIKSKHTTSCQRELKEWLNVRQKGTSNVKNCHIMRTENSKTGEAKILCKMLGEFYVVSGLDAYSIVYVNSLKIVMQDRRKGKNALDSE